MFTWLSANCFYLQTRKYFFKQVCLTSLKVGIYNKIITRKYFKFFIASRATLTKIKNDLVSKSVGKIVTTVEEKTNANSKKSEILRQLFKAFVTGNRITNGQSSIYINFKFIKINIYY